MLYAHLPLDLPRRPRGRAGFTLVEVLATVVLMGIVLPVAMHGISLCVASADTARRKNEAAALAETKLNELVATGDWQYGLLSGDFGEAWPEYRWNGGASEWTVPTVRQLYVRVSWASRGQERELVVMTLVFQGGTT